MTTTTSIARATMLFLCLFYSTNFIAASDNRLEEYEYACVEDFTIMKMDCMFALIGSTPCYGSYHIMYAPTVSDPYVSIGNYSVGTFYNITNDGCYKLKKICGGVCHESNVVVYSGCTSTTCDLVVNCPIPATLDHCYDLDGHVSFDAAAWVSGCTQVDYKWTTPIGTFNRAYIGGYHGYGTYKLTVTCHDQACAYETRTVTFNIKNSCASSHCDFEVKWPLASTIEHCYDTEGKVTIDAKPWVKGCSNVTYKWITPKGSYYSDWISGDYGYGTYKLEVICRDASCNYEKKTFSFILKDKCTRHHFQMYCPDDVTVECGAELWDLKTYGDAYYIYNGKKVWLKTAKEHHHLSECNRGYITREWKVKDHLGRWHECEQTIYVGQNAYGTPTIDWPKEEVVLEGCNPSFTPQDLPDGAQRPYYEDDGCSRFGHNYTDEVFYFNNTCKKVVRKWVVYDWCVYVPNSGSSKGRYTYYQTIKIVNSDEPVVSMPKDMKVSAQSCVEGRVDMDDLEVMAQSCGDKFEITHDSRYADKKGDNASGNYPVGKTTVNYKVKFGCGNTKEYKQYVVVENDKAPVPYCIRSIVTPLMGIDTDGDGRIDDGMAEIWAKDFDKGSDDGCGDEIQFSFAPDEIEMVMTFSCDQLGDNELRIYVSNSSGNTSYCVVNLTVQNNAADIPNCVRADAITDDNEEESNEENEEDEIEEDETEEIEEESVEDVRETETAEISGAVTLHYGRAVVDASLILYHSNVELMTTNSSDEGDYSFDELDMYEDYSIRPEKLSEKSRYVTREDSDRLYDHLSGRDPITDTYLLLAADIDQSGTIDFQDLSEVIQLENKLWNDNADWIFIKEGYEFEDPTAPWEEDYVADRVISDLDKDVSEVNFIAIRLGDLVDSSEDDLGENKTTARERSATSLVSPNPFTHTTNITFAHDKTQEGQLVVYKMNGEKVIAETIRISKGQNEIVLTSEDLKTPGVYIYSILLDDTILKGKLLKID